MAGDADFESTMELVMRKIYCSCDVDNTNRAPISHLIEFIKPYMLEDLFALDHLKCLLESNNENGYISSETFYSLMTQWAKKVANPESDDFTEISPDKLDAIDEKQLPYSQSTPRASFGQKLLSSECLLNISGASVNASFTQSKETNTVGFGKTAFEDEINRLEYHLTKCSNELEMVKLQLAASEEHNESLQADLERCKTRLQSEQQVNEHLQKNKVYCEELKEEICQSKKEIESLKGKLQQCEKDKNYMSTYVKELEQEINKLEDRCKQYVLNEQKVTSELCDIKAELDNNEQKIIELNKANEDLKAVLDQNKTKIIDLTSENNELLDYRTHTLEKTARRFSSSTAYAPRFSDSFRGTVPIYSPDQSLTTFDNVSFDENCPMSPINSPNIAKDARKGRRSFDVGWSKSKACQTAPLVGKKPTSCLLVRSASDDCSNLVQDIGSEEDELSFGYQNNVSLLLPCQSLQAELLQVTHPIDDATKEHIEALKSENHILKTKVDALTTETDHLYGEISKLEEHVEQLEEAIKKSQRDREELENRRQNTCGDAENTLVTEIQKKLAKLQEEYEELQRRYASKELEVEEHKKKFSFELAYKNVQKELNEKCQLLSDLQKEAGDYKSTICKLTNDNRALETALEELNEKLKEKEEVWNLHKDIEGMTDQVQTHIDKKNDIMDELVNMKDSLRESIKVLEDKLRDKNIEVEHLENILKSQEHIKNIMWRDNKDLLKQIEVLTVEKQKLADEVQELSVHNETINNEVTSFNESTKVLCEKVANLNDENKKLMERVNDMKQDYEALLTKHNNEVMKNSELCNQIYQQKEDLVSIVAKHKEETEKNSKLCEHIKNLKGEISNIHKNIKDDREKINTMISDYGLSLEALDRTIKDLERDNTRLKQELEDERKQTKKEQDSSLEPRKMSFEKQMISMNRLKEKMETLAEELRRERSLKDDVRMKLAESEKLQLQAITERDQTKQQLSELQNRVGELVQQVERFKQQEIEFNAEMEQLKFRLGQKEAHIKLNVDTIEEVKAKSENLKRQLEEAEMQRNQILVELSNKNSLCNSLHFQNDNLNHLLELSSKTCVELNAKLNEQSLLVQRCNATIANLSQTLCDKDKTIETFKANVAELEQKVANQELELSDKEKAFAKLLEENSELQAIRLLEKDTQSMKEKIELGRSTLRALDEDLNDLNHQVSNAKGELSIIQDEIDAKIELIYQCNDVLSRTFSLMIEKWGNSLQNDTGFLPQIKECQPSVIGLHDLYSNITSFTTVLQALTSKILSESADKSLSCQKLQTLLADSKNVKKFTLRPARFSVRSVSPDSSSLETGTTASVMLPVLNNSNIHESSIKEESTVVNRISLSPDSQASKSRSRTSRDTSICEIRGFPEVCFQTNVIFPHVTDAFLEKLGIQEHCTTMSLPRQEMEKIFILLASQVNLDSVDIHERLTQQKEQCEQYHRNCFCLMDEISVLLREHRCPAVDFESVLALLDDLTGHFQKTLRSAGQMGMLTCEHRMAICWKLVTNYISVLREDKAIQIQRQEKQTETEDLVNVGQLSKSPKISSRSACFDTLKMAFLWTILLMLIFMGLLAIHYRCQVDTDHQICSFDFFIQRIQLGNPPY